MGHGFIDQGQATQAGLEQTPSWVSWHSVAW